MKSLAERHAQRNEVREDAGLAPIDYGNMAGAARAQAPSQRVPKTIKGASTGEETAPGGGTADWTANA